MSPKLPPPPAHGFHPDVEDYFLQNGFDYLRNGIIPEAMVFLKKDMAVVLLDDGIDVKSKPPAIPTDCPQILFNWQSEKHYKGWNGQNIFQLMMLLDFMDVVKLKDVDKATRQKITTENLLSQIQSTYCEASKPVICQ